MIDKYLYFYTNIADLIFQFGLMGIILGGIWGWMRYRRRAKVLAALATPLYTLLWISLIAGGGGAVWTSLAGGDAMGYFMIAAIQVIVSMALLPTGLLWLEMGGVAQAPHLRLYRLFKRPDLSADALHSRKQNLYHQCGWKRYPWFSISACALFVVVFSLIYAIYLNHIFDPQLSPEFEELFLGRQRNPLLVMSVLLSAAIVEEIQFRMIGLGMAGWALKKWLGRDYTWLAIVIVSAVWAFGHTGFLVDPVLKETHIFAVGLIFGFMVRRYGATSSIFAHMCLNILASSDIFNL